MQREQNISLKMSRIWAVLSAYEEQSASKISDMLSSFPHGQYLKGSVAANQLIDHISVLFHALDILDLRTIEKSGKCKSFS